MINTKGLMLATAAAALFASGASMATQHEKAGAEVKCTGVNACKGKSVCKSSVTSCKGQNACKGKGVEMKTKADCEAKGGTVVE